MSPTLVSDEPLEMRGGNCPTRQDGRWGSEWRLCPRRRVRGWGGKDMESREWGPRKRAWPCFRLWVRGVGRKRGRVGGSSEPGLARSPRLFQTVTATQAISGDLPEDSEHGVPDSVRQSWDIIRCQPFCGHWG